MTTFEYVVDTIDTRKKKKAMPEVLAKRGEEGWELVSVVRDGATDLHLFFKRPKATAAQVVAQ